MDSGSQEMQNFPSYKSCSLHRTCAVSVSQSLPVPHATGGGLALAEGGVCLVGSLSTCKKELRERLQRSEGGGTGKTDTQGDTAALLSAAALETAQVTVDLPQRLGSGEAQQVSWPLLATVWACADGRSRSREFLRADVEIVKANTLHVCKLHG